MQKKQNRVETVVEEIQSLKYKLYIKDINKWRRCLSKLASKNNFLFKRA